MTQNNLLPFDPLKAHTQRVCDPDGTDLTFIGMHGRYAICHVLGDTYLAYPINNLRLRPRMVKRWVNITTDDALFKSKEAAESAKLTYKHLETVEIEVQE